MGIDLKDGKHNKPETSGWFAEQDFIARRSTSCAVAIQGVRPDEDASFTTMWTVIGYPPVTPAVLVWLKGADKKLPKALTVDQNKHAPLCDASNMLRDKIYSYHRGDEYGKLFPLGITFQSKRQWVYAANRAIGGGVIRTFLFLHRNVAIKVGNSRGISFQFV